MQLLKTRSQRSTFPGRFQKFIERLFVNVFKTLLNICDGAFL